MGTVTPPTLDGEVNRGHVILDGVVLLCAVARVGTETKRAWVWNPESNTWGTVEEDEVAKVFDTLDPLSPSGTLWRGKVVLPGIVRPVLCIVVGDDAYFWVGDDWIELLNQRCEAAVFYAWAQYMTRVADAERAIRKAHEAYDHAESESRPADGEVGEGLAVDLTANGALWLAILKAKEDLRALGREP